MQSLHKKSGVSTLTNFVVFSVKVWPQPNLSSFNAIPTPPGFVISSNLTSNFPLKAVLILWTPLCYCPIMLIDMQKRTSSLALNVVLSRTNICTPEHSPSQASLVFLSVLSLYSTDFALNTVLTLPMLLLPSLYSTKALLLLKYFPNKWIYFNRCVLLSRESYLNRNLPSPLNRVPHSREIMCSTDQSAHSTDSPLIMSSIYLSFCAPLLRPSTNVRVPLLL